MEFTRANVVAEARTLIGTPYMHQAALKGVGMDCIGVIRWIAQRFNRPESIRFESDPRFKGYGRPPSPRLLVATDEHLERIPLTDGLPGDIVLARIEVEPQHFALISELDPTRVIHSYAQVSMVTENIVDAAWKSRVLRMYRFPGIV